MLGHTARMAFAVWSTPHPGMTDEFERWYNEVHLPDAIENGSFVAMHRYEAVGPGYRAAPFLSVAEADYGDEAEAWAAVRHRAQSLHDAGRIDDLYRVDFATMLLTVDSDVSHHPVATLTTVQNDWRHPGGDAREWLASVPVPVPVPVPLPLPVPLGTPRSMQLLTTDPAGARGPGRHLALFESSTDPEATVAAWSGTGSPGSSPLPPYTTIFGVESSTPPADVPAADTWVAHWRHLLTVGR